MADQSHAFMFAIRLVLALLSGVAWYGVARLALGPAWGLWAGLCWVVYPAFFLLAQRAGQLAILIFLFPIVYYLLLRWQRFRGRLIALLLGTGLALTSLVSFQAVLFLLLVVVIMLLAFRHRDRSRWLSPLITLLTSVVVAGTCWALMISWLARNVDLKDTSFFSDTSDLSASACWSAVKRRVNIDLWKTVVARDESSIAQIAREELESRDSNPAESAVACLTSALWQSPGATARWLGKRAWGMFYRPPAKPSEFVSLILQFVLAAIAVWGFVTALSGRERRWFAVTGLIFVAAAWGLAAIVEPEARNLTPAGGLVVILALVGASDLYQRVSGRRRRESHQTAAAEKD